MIQMHTHTDTPTHVTDLSNLLIELLLNGSACPGICHETLRGESSSGSATRLPVRLYQICHTDRFACAASKGFACFTYLLYLLSPALPYLFVSVGGLIEGMSDV